MAPDPLEQLERLTEFVDSFANCFSRKGQIEIGKQYVEGVLGDASQKNMQGMWKRLANAVSYQSLQHFITHSSWDASDVWGALREKCPDREGVFVIDDTGIAKKGEHSVGVQRQYSGTLGKVGNCQIIVSAVLRATEGIWPLGMQLYLPKKWTSNEKRRASASIPEEIGFRQKWKIGLDLLDAAIASGIKPYCVVADAGYGECRDFRSGVRKRELHYSVGVKSDLKVFVDPPDFILPKSSKMGRPRTRRKLASNSPTPERVADVVSAASSDDWVEVAWREGTKGALVAEFLAMRVTPSAKWHDGQQNERCWLLCERPVGSTDVRKYHLSSLPEDTVLDDLVWVTHERWAIEHNYKQLKGELGLDHFEGRSYPGLHRHLALGAIAYYFLEIERQQGQAADKPTLNELRRIVTELFTMLYIANDPRARELMLHILSRPPPET